MDYSKIGHRLKLVREKKGLSYEQIFEITRIQPSILKDIEEGKVSISPVFLKGFIKTYARFLGLNIESLFKETEKEKEQDKNSKTMEEENDKVDKEKSYLRHLLPLLGLLIVFQLSIWILNSYKKDSNKEFVSPDNEVKTEKEEPVQDKNLQTPEDTEKDMAEEIQDETTEETANESQKEIVTENQTLFQQVKNSVLEKDVLIKSSESLEVYFKVDRDFAFTKTLQASVWFHIKAKESVYLRFDENRGQVQIFYNGRQIDVGGRSFFEKTFQ